MNLKLNSKLLFWIVVVFGIVEILDMITAMFILPGESNPIYLLTGSYMLLFVLKIVGIVLAFVVYFVNKYASKSFSYTFIYFLIIGIFMTSFGVYSNIMGILHPEILHSASQLSVKAKMDYYWTIVGFFMLIPYFISIVAFKVYEFSEGKLKYQNKQKHIKNDR